MMMRDEVFQPREEDFKNMADEIKALRQRCQELEAEVQRLRPMYAVSVGDWRIEDKGGSIK
jgi:predicted SprT family Zn-dependent metalloprotease